MATPAPLLLRPLDVADLVARHTSTPVETATDRPHGPSGP